MSEIQTLRDERAKLNCRVAQLTADFRDAHNKINELMAINESVSAEVTRGQKLIEKILDVTMRARFTPFSADKLLDAIDEIDWECRHTAVSGRPTPTETSKDNSQEKLCFCVDPVNLCEGRAFGYVCRRQFPQ